jgi:SAM-dependent methyltransferase
MSDGRVDAELRQSALARFEQHRQMWARNEAVRTLYRTWYGRIRDKLPDRALGPWLELGSGPGFAREVIPELELSDVVRAPWHDHEMAAESLPLPDRSLGALVLFDVLHHLRQPARFLGEAVRVLRPGGRVVLLEPYVGPLSFPVYKLLHEERCDFSSDPLGGEVVTSDDPFDGNQALPTQLLYRRRDELARRFPELPLREIECLAGPAYPASGGLSRRPLLPLLLWKALVHLEDRLPAAAFRLLGFRLLAVLERR